MKNIWSTIGTAVIVFVLVLIIGGFSGVLPVKLYHVLSGSMEPTISTGSVVAAYVIDPNELAVGDVVMFQPRGTGMVMHRIIGIEETESGRSFITQGDANNTKDPIAIYPDEIAGKVFMHIPQIGYAIQWVQNNLVLFLGGLAVVLFGGQAIINAFRKAK